MMFKSSLLVSAVLAAGAPACHHDHPTATPATAESGTTGGMTATAEPGNTSSQSNSDNTSNSDSSNATAPGATVPGNPQLPLTNDPDRTGPPGTTSGSGAPADHGTDTGDMGNQPDATTPTAAKDAGSGSNTGTGNGSNTARRSTSKPTTPGTPRSGSNGSGSADGSGGSGSDVPR